MILLHLTHLVPLLAAGQPVPSAESSVPVEPSPLALWQAPPPNRLQPIPQGRPSSRQPSYMQGLIGITELRVKDVNFDSDSIEFEDSEDATLPLIGGAVQRALTGQKLHLGVEGGFLLGWAGDVETVVIGGGTIAVASENDIFMMEGFGGLYADLMVGEKLRFFGGAGGLVDWASVDLEYSAPIAGYGQANGDGFGYGVYTRLGFDLLVQSGMRVGFCWRWFESEIDLGGEFNDLEIDGQQYMLTFTRSM